MGKYKNYVVYESLYNEKKDLPLDKTYEICVNELGLQQTKRDQIIAFYIAIISFVIPQILDMKVTEYAKAAGFFALYVLGFLLTKAVIRYRIYKEVYWITCRTISQLHDFKHEGISKDLVQHIFYKTLEKNMPNVAIMSKRKKEKIDMMRTYIKNRNSAETVLFEVIVILASLVLWIGLYIALPFVPYNIAAATLLALINLIYWCSLYCKRLISVYSVIIDARMNPSMQHIQRLGFA